MAAAAVFGIRAANALDSAFFFANDICKRETNHKGNYEYNNKVRHGDISFM